MGKFIVAVALLTLSTGCAQAVDDAPPAAEQPQQVTAPVSVTPSLRIDESLPVEYQDAAVFAAEAWTTAGFPIDVSITDSESANFAAGDCENPQAHGCAWPGQLVLVDLERMGECSWSRVGGMTTCTRMEPKFLALHEIGHFLGITEHLGEGNVMQPELTADMPPAELTEADVEALRAAQSSTSSVADTKSVKATTPAER